MRAISFVYSIQLSHPGQGQEIAMLQKQKTKKELANVFVNVLVLRFFNAMKIS